MRNFIVSGALPIVIILAVFGKPTGITLSVGWLVGWGLANLEEK